MKRIFDNLYIGNEKDYETDIKYQSGWAVVHACKEPYHRNLLGYKGLGAPKDNSEYFFADRGDRLYLNLVDAPNPSYIPKKIIDKALSFIEQKLGENKKVLVHCNQGNSRSAIIGFLFLAQKGVFSSMNFEDAEIKYKEIYPGYNPAFGTRGFAKINWDNYKK